MKFNPKKTKKNKYGRQVEAELDLHGYFKAEAEEILEEFLSEAKDNGYRYVRVITGKGVHSVGGRGVLNEMVYDYLRDKCYKFAVAKINEGGEGAFNINM